MKGLKITSVFFFAVLLTACHRPAAETRHVTFPPQSPELAAIDSLLWTQPDSALTRLILCYDTVSDRHYANLLLAELLYKNDYAQTNRAELQNAMKYFDSLSCPFLTARIHYINGVGYYERDSVVPACKEYLKAVETMEEHFTEKELVGKRAKFMAFAYTRLLDVYSDQYLHEQAIAFAKRSFPYYKKLNNSSWQLARMFEEIGSHYDMMEQLDSAFYYYNKALTTLPDSNNLTYRDIATIQVYLSYKKGACADSSLKYLYDLSARSESEKEFLSRYAIIGGVYYYEGIYDSAWNYLNSVFSTSSNIALKKQSAEWLAHICKAQGKNDELIEYASFLIPYANQEENQSELKSQLTELYNVFLQTDLERKHKQTIKKQLSQFVILIGLFLVVMVVVVLLYRRSLKHRNKLKKQIELERNVHQMQRAALSGRLRQSNRKVRDMENEIHLQGVHQTKSLEKEIKTFEDEPICRLILDRVNKGQFKSQMNYLVYKSYALNKVQLLELSEAANRHFNKFTIRLKKTYPQLTKNDLHYCCLYLLGLNDTDVYALMQRAYNTVNERNNKIKKILGSDDSITVALRSFANNQTTN